MADTSTPLTGVWTQQRKRTSSLQGPLAWLQSTVDTHGLMAAGRSSSSLSEREIFELLQMARRNMEVYVAKWDARERESDLRHSSTRVLTLRMSDMARTASSPDANTITTRSAETTVVGEIHAAHERRSSSRRSYQQPPCGVHELCADDTLAGFASYRFLTQETIPVVYLLELHVSEHWRRRGLGSLLLDAVRQIGRAARRQGLLLTVQLSNRSACQFYRAKGLEESPISPRRCAPPALAMHAEHEIMQHLWDAEARKIMESRGELARQKLFRQAGAALSDTCSNCQRTEGHAASSTSLLESTAGNSRGADDDHSAYLQQSPSRQHKRDGDGSLDNWLARRPGKTPRTSKVTQPA